MKLSVVIPAHNEEGNIAQTVRGVIDQLEAHSIEHEILVVNDHSTDGTARECAKLCEMHPACRCVENTEAAGFGMAVRCGLENFSGDAVAIVMADASDDPGDLVAYYDVLSEGYDCAFGSRFARGSKVKEYPMHKLLLNRVVNFFIRTMFLIRYNDVTNAFKAYRRTTIDGLRPMLSRHFNLTVELPLKAIVRGYSYKVVPTNWYGRQKGVSKLKIREMGSRYMFIILYTWLERILSRGDYKRSNDHDA